MKRWLLPAALLIAGIQLIAPQILHRDDPQRVAVGQTVPASAAPRSDAVVASATDELSTAFHGRRSNVQVSGEGVVVRVLADDHRGSRHQRFLLRLASGQTVLIAHNIDLAPRLEALRAGERVAFNGEYEWNERGGVIHWTHRDPRDVHIAGWLRRGSRSYQ